MLIWLKHVKGSTSSPADAVLQRTSIIGQIFSFRDALHTALEQASGVCKFCFIKHCMPRASAVEVITSFHIEQMNMKLKLERLCTFNTHLSVVLSLKVLI